MTVSFRIDGKIPAKSSSRKIVRNKKTGQTFIVSSDKTRQFEKDFALQTKNVSRELQDYDGKLCVAIIVHVDSNRQDIDGFPKVLLDCCQRNGIIKNDNRITRLFVEKIVDRDIPPFAVVTINEI